jgi:hypothetical protein
MQHVNATVVNMAYISLHLNFLSEIQRIFAIFTQRRKSPLDVFRNENIH